MFRHWTIVAAVFWGCIAAALTFLPDLVAIGLFLLIALGVEMWVWVTGERHHPRPRLVSEREPEIDLSQEWYEFQCRRDAFLEERQLRRVA